MRNQAKHFDTFTTEGKLIAEGIVKLINGAGGRARIADTWMDYGQSWGWETVIVYHKGLNMEYQALNPRDFREMNENKISQERIQEIVKEAQR